MSFDFPRGFTDISGLLLWAEIFQVIVQECTFGQTHPNSYMTILIRYQRDDVSECSSYLRLLWICTFLMWALFHTPWCKSRVVHSAYMTLWISMTYKINYCIFVTKQRPTWLMWHCFDAFVWVLCAVRVTLGKPESLPQTGLLKKTENPKIRPRLFTTAAVVVVYIWRCLHHCHVLCTNVQQVAAGSLTRH